VAKENHIVAAIKNIDELIANNLYFIRMRKTHIYLTVLTIIFFIVIAYISINTYSDEITPEEARENIKAGYYDFIVDVRTKQEWDESHLDNTISIPIGNLVAELPEKIPDKNTRILFVCKKGVRASGVVTIAHKLGYKNVQAMIGNFKQLQDQTV
jgi:phage shock protein E